MFSPSLLLLYTVAPVYLAPVNDLKSFLDRKLKEYNRPSFIASDPVSIPHRFQKKQDIEIAGLFAAVFAWGNRKTIIAKSLELLQRMDNAPYEFCTGYGSSDLQKLEGFCHRTFNDTDLLYFIEFLGFHYRAQPSLETAFTRGLQKSDSDTGNALDAFHQYFFSMEAVPRRTRKHISAPSAGSTCKRLNMFLRWMVRNDGKGIDFGIWKKIKPAQLVCPVDLHVARVARRLGLLHRKQTDWKAALELTAQLRNFDPADPVKYDLALFGMGAMEKN